MNEQGFHGYHDRILLETRKQSLEVNIGTTELFGTSYYQASFPKITRGGLLKNFCFWLERTSWLWTHKETQRKWEKSLWRSSAVEHPDPLSTCFFPKCILCNSVDLLLLLQGWWVGGEEEALPFLLCRTGNALVGQMADSHDILASLEDWN